MPRIFKSGKEFKGNKNSGRKRISEEVIDRMTEKMASDLAQDKTIRALKVLETIDEVKDIALPIFLKGMTERLENTLIIPKPILDGIISSDNSDPQDNKADKKD